jgi:hypothetical protein
MIAACISIIQSQYHSRQRINDYQKGHLTTYLPGPQPNRTLRSDAHHIWYT